MSPQIGLVVAVLLAVGIAVVFLLRAPGAGRREPSAHLAEPGAEGMNVADDGEIAPGAPGPAADQTALGPGEHRVRFPG